MPENSDYSQPISSRRMKEALTEATVILGRAAQDSMFHDLELNGITFKDRSHTRRNPECSQEDLWQRWHGVAGAKVAEGPEIG